MDEQAWPFLIGRTRTEDHRVVVLPKFLTAGTLVDALRFPADSDLPRSPESVQAREIEKTPEDRITVIYRVNLGQADYWGMDGKQVLTDEQGRPIVLTEGFVIGRPATAVRQDGITQEDLDRAHSLVVPAYLQFWAQGRDYSRQAAKSFGLAAQGKRVRVSLPSAPVPGVSERVEAPPPSEALAKAVAKRAEEHTAGAGALMSAGSAARAATGGHQSRARTATAVAIGVAVVVIAIVILLATRPFHGSSPAGPAADPARTMAALCDALQSGDPARGYATTTSAYQHATTKQKFAAELLPTGKTTAIRCAYRLQAKSPPTTASATMTVTEGPRAHSWQVTLSKTNGSTWQVSAIH
jgi:hypothetical protein